MKGLFHCRIQDSDLRYRIKLFPAIPGSLAVWFIFLPVYATVAPKLGFSTEYTNTLPIILTDPKFWLMGVVILPMLCLSRDFAWKYAKRMYYPQAYHHVQEIQKYNIQDYRPRYVSYCADRRLNHVLTFLAGWSNSRKLSGRSDRCSVCANNADMLFLKQMNRKHVCCRLMIRRGREEDMVRWRVRGDSIVSDSIEDDRRAFLGTGRGRPCTLYDCDSVRACMSQRREWYGIMISTRSGPSLILHSSSSSSLASLITCLSKRIFTYAYYSKGTPLSTILTNRVT